MSDFIVIGGGLSGMLVARELLAAGARATLLERGELGQEASWAGGGILSSLHPWRSPEAVTTLVQWSQACYPALATELTEETGIDPEWWRSGLLVVERAEVAEASAWARRWGASLEPVSKDRIKELEPGLALTEGGGGIWLPEVAQVRNPRLLQALARSLKQRGAILQTHTEVTGLLEENGRVSGVRTRTGQLYADGVVVTAGAWTTGLLGTMAAGWQIEPVRGQMLLFHAVPGLVRHIVEQDEHYLVPRRDGRVLAGSTVEYVGFDKSTTRIAYEALYAAAVALIPALARCPVERHWAGLRPGSAQGIPTIGAHPRLQGLYVNAGHFRNGVVTGPASARLLADLIFRRTPCVDPGSYSVPQ